MPKDMEHVGPPPEPTVADSVHTMGRAAASLLPLGGPILEFFNDFFRAPLQRRQQEWMKRVHEAIGDLQRRGVDVDALRRNEAFCDVVQEATFAAMRTHEEAKRDALRNAVTNAALPKPPSELKQQMFLRLVQDLSPLHLQLLDFMNGVFQWCKRNGRTYEAGSATLKGVALAAFQCDSQTAVLVHLAAADLYQRGLTKLAKLDDGGVLHSAKDDRTTPLGAEFLRFIRAPEP